MVSLVLGELKAIVKSQNGKLLHAQFTDKNEDKELTADFRAQVESLMNGLKSVTAADVLSRFDILHKI